MHIFLTGGTGFIGSHFIKLALEKSHNIKAIKRGKNSFPKILLPNNPDWLIKNFSELEKNDLHDCETLIHLASHSTNIPYDTLENCMNFNVIETLKLFNLAFASGIRKFIITGSCYEYGKKGEEYNFIPPDAPLFPTQSYPASKAAASILLIQWALERNVSLKILRLFQVYGEGELKTRLWPTLKDKAIKGEDLKMTFGEQIRDFIKVEDVAKLILSESLNLKKDNISIMNIGSGKPTKLKDFVKHNWSVLNAKGMIKFGEIPYRKNEIMRFVPKINEPYNIR